VPDPFETLGLLVEAAVAIAGFSGVVVVFGRRTDREWSPLERQRLEILLTTSFTVLFLAFSALILLHAGMAPVSAWRIGSAVWSLIAMFEISLTLRRAAAAPRDDAQLPHIAWLVILLGLTGLAIVLNLLNCFFIQQFWPFLSGLVWLFALSAYTFVRLLFVVGDGSDAA
jgi:hypothetical protein